MRAAANRTRHEEVLTSHMVGVGEQDRSEAERRFERAYQQHYHHIRAYCRRRVTEDRVDDTVAETFLVAWRRLDELPEPDHALPWLYGVAYRVVGHQWRSRSRRRRLDEKLAIVRSAPSPSPEDVAVQTDETTRVLEAATHLQSRDAEILRLLAWEQMTRPEIAEILGISPNTVSKRIQRARQNLTREHNRLVQRDLGPHSTHQDGGAT